MSMIVRLTGISSFAPEAALSTALLAVASDCRSNVPSAAKLLYPWIWLVNFTGAHCLSGRAIRGIITRASDHYKKRGSQQPALSSFARRQRRNDGREDYAGDMSQVRRHRISDVTGVAACDRSRMPGLRPHHDICCDRDAARHTARRARAGRRVNRPQRFPTATSGKRRARRCTRMAPN